VETVFWWGAWASLNKLRVGDKTCYVLRGIVVYGGILAKSVCVLGDGLVVYGFPS